MRKSRFGGGKPQTASNQLGQAKAMVQECCGRMAVPKFYVVCYVILLLGTSSNATHLFSTSNFSTTSIRHSTSVSIIVHAFFTIINSHFSSERYLTLSPTTLPPTITTPCNTLYNSSLHYRSIYLTRAQSLFLSSSLFLHMFVRAH